MPGSLHETGPGATGHRYRSLPVKNQRGVELRLSSARDARDHHCSPVNAELHRTPVEVAVGVLVRDDGQVLLARRPPSKVYAGYWEFPGGKVEPGESVYQALVRELDEELGIHVETAYRWITQEFDYPHAIVHLNFFRVMSWSGELRAIEHDGMSWNAPDDVRVSPVLPANGPVLRGLALPGEYAITNCSSIGMDAQLRRIRERLSDGLRLIQVREPEMRPEQREAFLGQVKSLAAGHRTRVLLNSDLDLALRVGVDGIHLTSRQLSALREIGRAHV